MTMRAYHHLYSLKRVDFRWYQPKVQGQQGRVWYHWKAPNEDLQILEIPGRYLSNLKKVHRGVIVVQNKSNVTFVKYVLKQGDDEKNDISEKSFV